jgi:hypothetical protein
MTVTSILSAVWATSQTDWKRRSGNFPCAQLLQQDSRQPGLLALQPERMRGRIRDCGEIELRDQPRRLCAVLDCGAINPARSAVRRRPKRSSMSSVGG